MPRQRRIVTDFNNPAPRLVRLREIVGDPKAVPPIPAILPIGKSAWWAGVKSGRFPQPVKLGTRTTCWRLDDVLRVVSGGV